MRSIAERKAGLSPDPRQRGPAVANSGSSVHVPIAPTVHTGGPGRSPRSLRDVLEARIDAVPASGAIDWMTYYFRDEALAEALARAHRRGVKVRLCVEGRPRLASANDRVIRLLADPGLGIGAGLRIVRHLLPLHLHSKIYCFSHPRPTALVGSFNPSGNEPEDADVIADIGDQDRGHNLLIEVGDPLLVQFLAERVAELHANGGAFRRPWKRSEATIRGDDIEGVFFPLLARSPLVSRLRALNPGASLRIAASHVRDPFIARELASLVRRGVEVTLLTGHTLRRTPRRTERFLIGEGIEVQRFVHPDSLPMHAKFILADNHGQRWSAFGSYNLTLTSRWLNHELLMFSSDMQLWRQLSRQWNEILAFSTCSTATRDTGPSPIPVMLEPPIREA